MLTLEEEKCLVLLTSIIELGGAPSKARALTGFSIRVTFGSMRTI